MLRTVHISRTPGAAIRGLPCLVYDFLWCFLPLPGGGLGAGIGLGEGAGGAAGPFRAAATPVPTGDPRPVQASQPGPALKAPLLPEVMS